MQVFNAVPGTNQVVQCNTKSSLKGLAAYNRALNYPSLVITQRSYFDFKFFLPLQQRSQNNNSND